MKKNHSKLKDAIQESKLAAMHSEIKMVAKQIKAQEKQLNDISQTSRHSDRKTEKSDVRL